MKYEVHEVIERYTDEFVTGMAELDRVEALVRDALDSFENLR